MAINFVEIIAAEFAMEVATPPKQDLGDSIKPQRKSSKSEGEGIPHIDPLNESDVSENVSYLKSIDVCTKIYTQRRDYSKQVNLNLHG